MNIHQRMNSGGRYHDEKTTNAWRLLWQTRRLPGIHVLIRRRGSWTGSQKTRTTLYFKRMDKMPRSPFMFRPIFKRLVDAKQKRFLWCATK